MRRLLTLCLVGAAGLSMTNERKTARERTANEGEKESFFWFDTRKRDETTPIDSIIGGRELRTERASERANRERGKGSIDTQRVRERHVAHHAASTSHEEAKVCITSVVYRTLDAALYLLKEKNPKKEKDQRKETRRSR